jgi:hypothetical protein
MESDGGDESDESDEGDGGDERDRDNASKSAVLKSKKAW